MPEQLTSEAIVNEGIKTIKELMAENHLIAAYQATKEIQNIAPYNRTINKLQKKCLEGIRERNIKRIDDAIKALEPLWQTKNYVKLVEEYSKLTKIDADYEKLQKLLDKAKQKANIKGYNEAVVGIGTHLKNAKQYLSDGKLKEALEECSEALSIDSNNQKAREMLEKIKDEFIKVQIKSEKFEKMNIREQVQFLREIKKVNEKNKKLNKLLEKKEKKLHKNQKLEEKSYVAKGISKAKFYVRQNMYEKAYQALKEVLAVSPKSQEALKMVRIVDRKFDSFITDKIFKDLDIIHDKVEEDYNRNKAAYIRIY